MNFFFTRRAAMASMSVALFTCTACQKSEPSAKADAAAKTEAAPKADATAKAPSSATAEAAAKSSPAATTPAGGASTSAPKAAPVPDAVKKVFGKWLRIDGGYVLEIRSADLSGVLDAGYFNPKSIRVSRAAWMQGGAGLQVMVELNDVGYPGATYVLTYDPQNDRLVGTYNQPQMQQSFDIEFVRQPKQ